MDDNAKGVGGRTLIENRLFNRVRIFTRGIIIGKIMDMQLTDLIQCNTEKQGQTTNCCDNGELRLNLCGEGATLVVPNFSPVSVQVIQAQGLENEHSVNHDPNEVSDVQQSLPHSGLNDRGEVLVERLVDEDTQDEDMSSQSAKQNSDDSFERIAFDSSSTAGSSYSSEWDDSNSPASSTNSVVFLRDVDVSDEVAEDLNGEDLELEELDIDDTAPLVVGVKLAKLKAKTAANGHKSAEQRARLKAARKAKRRLSKVVTQKSLVMQQHIALQQEIKLIDRELAEYQNLYAELVAMQQTYRDCLGTSFQHQYPRRELQKRLNRMTLKTLTKELPIAEELPDVAALLHGVNQNMLDDLTYMIEDCEKAGFGDAVRTKMYNNLELCKQDYGLIETANLPLAEGEGVYVRVMQAVQKPNTAVTSLSDAERLQSESADSKLSDCKLPSTEVSSFTLKQFRFTWQQVSASHPPAVEYRGPAGVKSLARGVDSLLKNAATARSVFEDDAMYSCLLPLGMETRARLVELLPATSCQLTMEKDRKAGSRGLC